MLTRILSPWPHGFMFDGDPAGGTVTPPPAEPPPLSRKFTDEQQVEIEELIKDRLTRQRAQLERLHNDKVAEIESKYAGFDDLKAKADQFDALEAEKKSDLERLEGERDAAAAERDQARADADAATRAAAERTRRADIVAAAAAAGADPDLTYAYLRDREFKVTAPKAEGEDVAQSYEVTVADDGQVTGHEDAVKAAIAAKPGLVGQTPDPGPGPSDGGARTPASTPDLQQRIAEAEAKGDFDTSMALKAEQFAQT